MVTFYILRDYEDQNTICGSFVSSLSVKDIKKIEDKADTTYLSNKERDDKATIFFRLLKNKDPKFEAINIVEIDF